MGVTFGGKRCVDPQLLHRDCIDRDWPTPWFGEVNQFVVPLGHGPGTGAVILQLRDLAELLPSSYSRPTPAYDLVFSDDTGNVVTLKKISILSYDCLTPGHEAELSAAYRVKLVDRRHFLTAPINRGYNVSRSDGAAYLSATLPNGAGSTPYSWQSAFDSLWSAMSLTAPTLPFTPHSRPENLTYYGGYAWDAINDFLDRLACRIKLDLTTDTFSVIRLGENTEVPLAAMAGMSERLLRTWDAYAGQPDYSWRPEQVRVLFPIRPEPSDGSSPWYPVDITLAASPGVPTGSRVILYDDLTALGSTPSNSATLTARAQERADDWLRKRRNFDAPLQIVWKHAQPLAVKTVLSSRVDRVAHEERGQGQRTEAASRPDWSLEKWRPGKPPHDCTSCAPGPIVTDGSGSGDGSGDGDPDYPVDYFDPFLVSDTECINGILVVTRCRIGIVYDPDSGKYRNYKYDCVATEEGCCECTTPSSFSGSGDDDEGACCTGTILSTIGFVLSGQLGTNCGPCAIAGDLDRAPPDMVWHGGDRDVCDDGTTASVDFSVYCQGGTWWASGAVRRPGQTRNDIFNIQLTDDGTDLTGEIPLTGCDPAVLVIDRPCDPVSAGGAPCQDNPGGSIDTATVSNKTGDCTCFPDTLTYDGPVLGSIATWSYAGCPGNASIDLFCENGQYVVYFGGVAGTIISFTASPFELVVRSPDLGANCGTSGTVDVTITVT